MKKKTKATSIKKRFFTVSTLNLPTSSTFCKTRRKFKPANLCKSCKVQLSVANKAVNNAGYVDTSSNPLGTLKIYLQSLRRYNYSTNSTFPPDKYLNRHIFKISFYQQMKILQFREIQWVIYDAKFWKKRIHFSFIHFFIKQKDFWYT